jgi:hypothetical protein
MSVLSMKWMGCPAAAAATLVDSLSRDRGISHVINVGV